ncbi:hypothetical protein [Streptomyces silvisoli]|uniref:Uncharacterized protein n=1 Tax=Streptomyces silvisoli TaxID=3034235 RepID=A0ABT5ZSU2_9ACTN|nr:hypothetical protein [Streptomyces silvisoli]MDF3292892.1 hypothetical protein [Streptomyces silvisoli]
MHLGSAPLRGALVISAATIVPLLGPTLAAAAPQDPDPAPPACGSPDCREARPTALLADRQRKLTGLRRASRGHDSGSTVFPMLLVGAALMAGARRTVPWRGRF